MRGGLVVILGLCAVGILGWLMLGDSGTRPADDIGIDDLELLDDDDGGEGIVGTDDEGSDGSTIVGTDDDGTGGGGPIKARASWAEGVRGTVISAEGGPIGGATIQLFERVATVATRNHGRPDGESVASTMTGEDGTFRVGPAPEGVPLRVRAEAKGFAPGIADVAVRGASVQIVLDRGGLLRIRIVDRAGEPVADAKGVHIADDVVTVAPADDEGVALFETLPAGSGTLVITAPGYRSVRDTQVAVTTDEESERTVVLETASQVEGTVVDGNTEKPVTDAQVTLHYPTLPTLSAEPQVATDHEGRFQLTNHAGERERIQYRVMKAGYAEARNTRSASDTSTIVIKLNRKLDAFRGIVYDTNRIPAAGIRVTYGRIGGLDEGENPPETRTKENGTFRLPPPPWASRGSGYQVIAISSAGEIGQRYVSIPAKPEQETKRIEIFLVGSGQLNGKVFDSDRAPVEGAVVTVEPDWTQRAGAGLHWQVFQAVKDRRLLKLQTVTDENGDFLFLRVPAMAFRVEASKGSERGTSGEAVVISPGQMSQMDVTLGTGGSIQGWVHDDQNDPVPGAQVRAIPVQRQPGSRTRSLTTRSRSDGTFELRGAGEGRYQLTATMIGFGSAVAKDVESGQTGVELILPQRGRIVGQVVMDGRPFRGTFTANARPSGQTGGLTPMAEGRAFSGGSSRTFNSEDGEFKLAGLPNGTYTVHVSTPDGLVGASRAVKVTEGQDSERVRVQITAGAVIRGRVRDDARAPMADAWVQVWPRRNVEDNDSATTGRSRTKKDGTYEVKGLGPGQYNVTVWARGRNWSVDVELGRGEKRTLDLVYEQPGRIEILVVDTDDRPIAEAQPDLVNSSGVRVHANYQASKRDGLIQDPQDWARMQRTDGNGRVVRHHVPPGRYKITARHRDYEGTSGDVWVEVEARGASQAKVVLRRKDGE